MLGFTVPLFVLLGIESLLALLLLGPRSFAAPALLICKSTRSSAGRTVLNTIGAFLLVSLASPIYDLARLRAAQSAEGGPGLQWNRSEAEANAYLAMVMILSALLLMVLVRRLGLAIVEIEQLRVSRGAILKQVKGLQTEYSRLLESSGGADGQNATLQVKQLKEKLEAAEAKAVALQEARAAQAAAERDLQVVRSQAKGLETEYDRLLSEHDELQRRLRRCDPTYGGGGRSNKFD